MIKIFLSLTLFLFSTTILGRGVKHRLLLDFIYGLSYINPSDINDKILDEVSGLVTSFPDTQGISFAENINLSVSYSLSYRYALGLALDIVYFNKTEEELFETTQSFYAEGIGVGKYFSFDTSVATYGIGPSFTYFIFEAGKINLSASLAALYYLGFSYIQNTTYGASDTDLNLDTNLKTLSGTGSTFGGILSVSGNYYLTNYLSLGLNLGYRYIKTPSLVDENGNTLNFTWLNGQEDVPASELQIPLGGPFFTMILRLDFNISKGEDSDENSVNQRDDSLLKEDNIDEVNISDSEDFIENVSDDNIADDSNNIKKYNNKNSAVVVVKTISINELYKLKKQTSKQYHNSKRKGNRRCVYKMKKLYNLIEKIENNLWDKLSTRARKLKLKKINKILESC